MNKRLEKECPDCARVMSKGRRECPECGFCFNMADKLYSFIAGVETIYTGGNVMNDVIYLKSGKVVVIHEEGVVMFTSADNYNRCPEYNEGEINHPTYRTERV